MKIVRKIANRAELLFAKCKQKGFKSLSQEELKEVTESLLELLRELESHLIDMELAQEDEISFFKVIKPTIAGRAMFLHKLMFLEKSYIANSNECHRSNYSALQKEIQNYIRKNENMYLYYKSGVSEMDNLYFTRKNQCYDMTWSKLSLDCYSIFHTSQSKVCANFICYELLTEFINNRLEELVQEEIEFRKTSMVFNPLIWTGKQIYLVELGYALYSSNVINKGGATIKEIMEVLSDAFSIDLGDYYRSYQDIRDVRKEQTKFLDKLKSNLLDRMNSKE